MRSPESAPTSYSDVSRATVPNPDGSYSPTRGQVKDSHAQTHVPPHDEMTGDERELCDRVREAILADGHTTIQHVLITADGARIILRGIVPGPSNSARIEDVAASVKGVAEVYNELDIEPTDPTDTHGAR